MGPCSQGFPGNVAAAVTYTLTADSRLLIDFEATSDAPTPIAMGQHTYFNLDGVAAPGTVLEHQLFVNGCKIPLPFDPTVLIY